VIPARGMDVLLAVVSPEILGVSIFASICNWITGRSDLENWEV
jgi:hypothetical protein